MKPIPHLAIACCALTVAVPAWAQDKVAGAIDVVAMDSPPLSDAALGTVAGREDTRQAALASQTAGVTQNSVGDHVTTGDARISDNAFQNMSGLSILNVNTGNNVAVNAAMNVNIAITPAR